MTTVCASHILCAVPTLDLLSTSEAAEQLGIHYSTISRWVQLGRMTPAHRLPGKSGAFLFTPEEVARVAAAIAEPTDGEAVEAS